MQKSAWKAGEGLNTWLEMQFPQESVPLKAINDTQIQPFATHQLEKTEIRFVLNFQKGGHGNCHLRTLLNGFEKKKTFKQYCLASSTAHI